ncbi:hypothetical protein BS17DRAFT_711193 [Gyrodon lividus]|nr:hypothetical protein BS17DRAFT_711193 [Gyrodon lividus]
MIKRCCCRRMLYNEPDFDNVQSTLELACASEGVHVLFLPKLHCELNFIEQCWGHAKRTYLTGRQVAWASKKYRGHRVLPNLILDELEHIITLIQYFDRSHDFIRLPMTLFLNISLRW